METKKEKEISESALYSKNITKHETLCLKQRENFVLSKMTPIVDTDNN